MQRKEQRTTAHKRVNIPIIFLRHVLEQLRQELGLASGPFQERLHAVCLLSNSPGFVSIIIGSNLSVAASLAVDIFEAMLYTPSVSFLIINFIVIVTLSCLLKISSIFSIWSSINPVICPLTSSHTLCLLYLSICFSFVFILLPAGQRRQRQAVKP
ncbi:membrane protein [Candidatus Magnetobacterium bavaricum]|uniref:Membrane protein n=1 Tax=Candidatus Magnetobacterium bavaricum TaxID=29290 RepID=A0A0F3GKN0_9BACT|nr:membrane protein [Candidatus Magnetobacterium bavaricum]